MIRINDKTNYSHLDSEIYDVILVENKHYLTMLKKIFMKAKPSMGQKDDSIQRKQAHVCLLCFIEWLFAMHTLKKL